MKTHLLIPSLILALNFTVQGHPTAPSPDREAFGTALLTNLAENQPTDHSDCWAGARPDGHAPIGVMGEHTHGAGEWMVSYRYMFMSMQENYHGSSAVSDASVVSPAGSGFFITPTDMEMEMHMYGIMFAPTDRLTLMGMVNYVESSMNHLTRMGGTFRTESSGVGDSSLTALYRFWDGPGMRMHAGLGVILPTAELDHTDLTPLGVVRLPYPMQSGAGSWGLAPSLTSLGQSDHYSWGSQLNARFYLDDNDEGYRLGNRGELTAWGARRINDWASLSLRASASTWGNISGSDPNIATTNPMGVPLVPTADPKRRGGSKIDLSLGLNFQLPIDGARLAVEAGRPVWQDLDGPQLASDWWFVSGLQFAF